MGFPRIIRIDLDERSIIRRSAEIEQERQVAIDDLLAANHFDLAGRDGPFRLRMSVADGRLLIAIHAADGAPMDQIRLGMARFRRPIRDYFQVCESYFKAVRGADPRAIETIDMARRAIHDDAATLLRDCLAPQVEVDFDTARRLFTLLCVLHIRAGPTVAEPRAGVRN